MVAALPMIFTGVVMREQEEIKSMWAWFLPTLLARRPTKHAVDDELTDGRPNETNNQLAKRLFESRRRRAELGE